jgi:hypothetical protein
VLDEELGRLPDRYRAVVVLCDLEGKTRKDAAVCLGVPEGTVAGWSARARKLLAERLARRGVALSAGAWAGVLSPGRAAALPAVVAKTIEAAVLSAAGQAATGVISANVAALTEGVQKAMLVAKFKTAAGMLLAVALTGLGAGLVYYGTAAAQPGGKKGDPVSPQKQTDKPAPKAPGDAKLGEARKLQEKRLNLLRQSLELREKLCQNGRAEIGGVIEASKRLLAAELDFAAKDAERIDAHERLLRKARALVELARAKKMAALGTEADVLDAQALALEAEIGLLKAGGKPKKAEK